MVIFDSLNQYQSLEQITANSPEELVIALKQIRTPITIVAIVALGARHVAYIMGDIRKNEPKQKQTKK